MSNFEPNAMLRGAQLTIVGAFRALQNPELFKHDHYKQALLALALGVIIQILLTIPVLVFRASIWTTSLFVDLETVTWDNVVIEALDILQHSVLQIPFFLMTLIKYISPALDNMFMESLEWVDRTYIQKHQSENPDTLRAMYYPNLTQYESKARPESRSKGFQTFIIRSLRKAAISLSIYLVSFTPYVGRLVLPAVSFYTFNRAVGIQPALIVFASGLVLPKKYLVVFLQSYFASRSLMRELLAPYFGRIRFSSEQKKAWFLDREGVLFGFGIGFFALIKIPIVGVLVYGLAEASTAYLITKITDPPPPPSESEGFAQTQLEWKSKKKFLELPLGNLDAFNSETSTASNLTGGKATELPSKKFT